MNRQNAEAEGLSFTGLYSSNKEEYKARLVDMKAARPKARFVTVWSPTSKLSRSYCAGGGGWSAYADAKYFAYSVREDSLGVINRHEPLLLKLKQDYDKAVAEAMSQLTYAQEKLKTAEATINL
jgi:hypothetical protein